MLDRKLTIDAHQHFWKYGFRLRIVVGVDDFRFLHFMPEIIAFTGSLTDSGKDREAAMVKRDVVDEFHDDDGLADPGAAKETDLATLRIRFQKIHDLDTGLQYFSLRLLSGIEWFTRTNSMLKLSPSCTRS